MIIVQNTQRVVIPKDGAIFWTGSTPPVGWEFFDTPNNYYLMGNSSNSFSALGASTHYHNNTGSTPAGGNHNDHGNGITSVRPNGGTGAWQQSGYSYKACYSTHTHGMTITSQSDSGTHTHAYGDTDYQSNEPPYITLRLIKALSDRQMPSGGIIMTNTANSNPLMLVCDGTNGTPDIRGRYVKCYTTTLSTGGSSSHSHGSISCESSGSHNHTIKIVVGQANAQNNLMGGASFVGTHSHNDISNYSSSSSGAHTHTSSINSITVIPPYYDVNFLKASAEISDQLEAGNIIMWLGGTIPSGWARLSDLDNKFPKGLYGSETLGSTGGSASHTHTIASTSSDGAHEHNISGGSLNDVGGGGGGWQVTSPNIWIIGQHNHSWSGKLNSAGTHTHEAGTTDSADNLPPYMKIIYIVKNRG